MGESKWTSGYWYNWLAPPQCKQPMMMMYCMVTWSFAMRWLSPCQEDQIWCSVSPEADNSLNSWPQNKITVINFFIIILNSVSKDPDPKNSNTCKISITANYISKSWTNWNIEQFEAESKQVLSLHRLSGLLLSGQICCYFFTNREEKMNMIICNIAFSRI